jgi:DNA modification methylase
MKEDKGKYDKRNKLNNLTGKEWLKLTKSFWESEKSAQDKFAFNHPAPYLVKDTEKLISMFTKKKAVVLDPFSGVGTTSVAADNIGRSSIGIDLNEEYIQLTKKRFKENNILLKNHKLIHGDSLKVIRRLKDKIDYCVTSPPYHNILRNKGNGIRKESESHRQGPRTGVEYYSENENDLGNQESFDDYINLLNNMLKLTRNILKKDKYLSIVISDFTVNKKEVNVLGKVIDTAIDAGFEYCGTIALLQNSKSLYPFGYPYAYKINHHHQSILNFRNSSKE